MASPAPPVRNEDDASWRRYRLISDQSTDVVYETDNAGVVQWISPSVQALLGWEPAALVGRTLHDLVHPSDRDRLAGLRTSFYTEGIEHSAVTCMIALATGGYREVSVRSRPLTDADGTITGAVITLTDTHDRDSALRALATLSQANRALVRATDEIDLLARMCRTLIETGRYALAWYGRPIDDDTRSVAIVASAGEVGYLDQITVSWGDNAHGQGPTGRCLRTGETQVQNRLRDDPGYQPWSDAATRHGFGGSISLPVRVDGAIDGALMVYADEPGAFDALAQDLLEDLAADLGYGIERLRALDDLVRTITLESQQRQRLQSTLDSMLDPFVILEAIRDESGTLVDLRYSMANDAAIAYNRVSREEFLGTTVLALSPGQLEHGPMALYFATIETGEPVVLDDYAYDFEPVGEERRFDIRAIRSGDGIALTWRDVTDRHRAAQALVDSERQFRLLAENSSDVIILAADQDATCLWVSPSVERMLGWTPDDFVGMQPVSFLHPDDVAATDADFLGAIAAGRDVRQQYRLRCSDGSYRWVEALTHRVPGSATDEARLVVRLRDITDQVRAEEMLAAREEHYRLLAENASDIVWQIAPDGTLEWSSPSVTRVLGWSPADLLGTVAMNLVHPDDRERAMARPEVVLVGQTEQGEFRMLRADGSTLWMSVTVHPVVTPKGVTRVLSLRDIGEEVSSRTMLEFALGHDQLTGLARRDVLLTRIDYLRTQLGPRRAIAVLCVGVDALGEVNEALGHAAGDTVLTAVATHVVEAAGSPDAVGRGSGDELLVILTDLSSGADAADLAERIRHAVQVPVHVAGQSLIPTVSVGIATGGASASAEHLLREASLAMRKAKNLGRDQSVFADPTLGAEAEHRIAVEAAIRSALAAGAFQPWFQPIVELAHGTVVGYEALARWVHADGVHLPDDFIAIAARSSLLTEIDLTMLEPVIDGLRYLPDSMFVGLNVTGQTLARTPYADLVISALDRAGVDPHRLHLEVTETMLLSLDDDIIAKMRALSDRGCRWYVDDFGTGYSSISHLRDLPVRGLKLDKSFTDGIAEGDETSRQLANALVGLANGLDLDTVAEGIETEAQARYLRTLGWQHGQGWLYGKAAPLA